MSRDGGGWTLLVSSVSGRWNPRELLSKNTGNPTLNGDYSILGKANLLKNYFNVDGDHFEYRVEASRFGKLVRRM